MTEPIREQLELTYFRRLPPFRFFKRWLSVAAALLAIAWVAAAKVRNDRTLYSSGPMSSGHAFLENRCHKCHTRPWRVIAGLMSPSAADGAMNQTCLTCHAGTIGVENESLAALHSLRIVANERTGATEPADVGHVQACHLCHREHEAGNEGGLRLAEVGDAVCTACHAGLEADDPARTSGFAVDHPQFRVLAESRPDPTNIKLNHAVHLKPDRRGPDGRPVQMTCSDCHRAGRTVAPWPFSRPALHRDAGAAVTADEPHLQAAYMNPIRYDLHCAGCHRLAADVPASRLDGGAEVPHDSPAAIRTFLHGALTRFIREHPERLDDSDERQRTSFPTLREPLPEEMNRLVLAWVDEEVRALENKIYKEKKVCACCHEQVWPNGEDSLPTIAPPGIPRRWFAHAAFSHERHRVVDCVSCHEQATTSEVTADVLLPGIETCQTCHAPAGHGALAAGGVTHDCVVCHTYHRPPPGPIGEPALPIEELLADMD